MKSNTYDARSNFVNFITCYRMRWEYNSLSDDTNLPADFYISMLAGMQLSNQLHPTFHRNVRQAAISMADCLPCPLLRGGNLPNAISFQFGTTFLVYRFATFCANSFV